MNLERLFLDHLPVIEQAVQFIARRHHLAVDEAEELASTVKLKIIENDYEILRKFRGGSSLRTYLTVIAQRQFLDARISRWGKWRPSVQARRLGPVALLLDRMISRDSVPIEEAVEAIRTNHGVSTPADELHAIARQLPVRTRRQFSGPEELDNLRSAVNTDEPIETIDACSQAGRIEQALSDALQRLPLEDRLLLKLRFQDNFQVSQISRLLAMDQKRLYRRLDHVIKALRDSLEALGVSREEVVAIVGHPATYLSGAIETHTGNTAKGPSR